MTGDGATRCDFCSSPEPVRLFGTGEFILTLPGADYVDVPGWWACAVCAALVDAEDREALAQRALARLGRGGQTAAQSLATIKAAHALFFAVRQASP